MSSSLSSLMNMESEIRPDCLCGTGCSVCDCAADGLTGEEIRMIGSLLRGPARRAASGRHTTAAFEAGVFDVDADAAADAAADAEASFFAR